MNSSPYMLPAFIIVVAVLFGCLAWLYLSVTQPSGQHARRRAQTGEGARFGAYLRGEDPGEQPAPEPATEPDDPADAGWWDVPPPPGPVTADPGPAIAATSATTLRVLTRIRDALMPDAWKPEPAAATFTPAGADETCTDLPAIRDVPQYLAAPQ